MEDYTRFKSDHRSVTVSADAYLRKTMIEVVDESAKARPYRAMLLFNGSKLVYDDFIHHSDALAAELVSSGIGKGDRVAMLLPGSPQLVLGLHGIWKAGGTAVPLDPLYTQQELERALTETGATAVISVCSSYGMLKNVRSKTKIRTVVMTGLKEYLPLHRRLLSATTRKQQDCRITLERDDIWLGNLIKKHRRAGRPKIEVTPSDPAIIFWDAGAAGMAEGTVATHRTLVQTAVETNARLSTIVEPWEDRVMLGANLSPVFDYMCVLGCAMVNHSTCILVPGLYDLTAIIKGIKKYEPALIAAVPGLCTDIMHHPLVQSGKVSLKNLKVCMVGGSSLTADIKQQFESVTGGRVLALPTGC